MKTVSTSSLQTLDKTIGAILNDEKDTAEAIAAAAYARVGGKPAYGDFNYDLGMALAPVCVKHKQVILTTIRISAGVLLRASNAVNRIGAALEAWLADEDL